jgi:hypothetical protein
VKYSRQLEQWLCVNAPPSSSNSIQLGWFFSSPSVLPILSSCLFVALSNLHYMGALDFEHVYENQGQCTWLYCIDCPWIGRRNSYLGSLE